MRKKAVILAGGRGTRLRPYTVSFPKPLMPVGDTPILEVVLRQLVDAGFEDVTLAVGHQAELIRAFFGDGSKWRARLAFSLEEKPLGTMGPLRLLRDLPEDFLVMNGDILTDLRYGAFFERHCRRGAVLSIAATRRDQPVDYGILTADAEQNLVGFEEKPVLQYLVSTGIYAASRRVLDWIPADEPFGFDQLVLRLLAAGERVAVETHRGYWLDIGRPDDYERAVRDVESGAIDFLGPPNPASAGARN